MRLHDVLKASLPALALGLTLAGCQTMGSTPTVEGDPSKLDKDGLHACSTFASGWSPGMAQSDEAALANKVSDIASYTVTAQIKSAAAVLVVYAATPSWGEASDNFAGACDDLGFQP